MHERRGIHFFCNHEVRIKLRDEATHRAIFSPDLPGTLDATLPADVDLSRYDLVGLARQEPQYTNHTIRVLMIKIAEAKLPCLSIMNMPPLPYLKRIPALAEMDLEDAYTNAQVWERFEPGLVSLCSPDPQAFRPPEDAQLSDADASRESSLDCRLDDRSTVSRIRRLHLAQMPLVAMMPELTRRRDPNVPQKPRTSR
jgi:hypothetical protein